MLDVKRGDVVLSKSGNPFVVEAVSDPDDKAAFCTLYSPRMGVTLAGHYTARAFEDGRLTKTTDTYDLDSVEEQRLEVARQAREVVEKQKQDAAKCAGVRVKRTKGEG